MPSPPKPGKTGKRSFEDGVHTALVIGSIICAVVLGTGAYYVVKSVIDDGGSSPLSARTVAAVEQNTQELPDVIVEPPVNPQDIQAIAEEVAPDIITDHQAAEALEQALRDLEAASAASNTATLAQQTPATPPQVTEPPPPPQAPVTSPQPVPQAAVPTPPAVVEGRKYLAIVIDDAGNNLSDLQPFLRFPAPLTIAVLPGLPNSVEAARQVRAAGKELFLHQPMEPLNGSNPGPKAITMGMSPTTIRDILVSNLTEIGPVAGVNNHEGSRATSDAAIMRPFLEICRNAGIFFLDSRTTAQTTAPFIAREIGLNIAQRDIFLDNEQDRDSIIAALQAGCKKAEQNGQAILIGHAWTPQLAAILTEMHPQLTKQGFVFVSVGTLLTSRIK